MMRDAILLLCLRRAPRRRGRPSRLHSGYGPVSQVEFSTGLLALYAGVLAFHPDRSMRDFRFAEPVCNTPPRENYLCHTFFGGQRHTA